MATIHVTRDEHGRLTGASEKDRRAYARFRRRLEQLEPGEILTLEVWFPRNPKLHRLHFSLLSAIFDAQEQFHDPEQLRMWLQVGAGHCDFVPGPKGKMVALPRSIAFHRMDDEEFRAHHEKVKEFLRSERAARFLWPHLDEQRAVEMVETILSQFEGDA